MTDAKKSKYKHISEDTILVRLSSIDSEEGERIQEAILEAERVEKVMSGRMRYFFQEVVSHSKSMAYPWGSHGKSQYWSSMDMMFNVFMSDDASQAALGKFIRGCRNLAKKIWADITMVYMRGNASNLCIEHLFEKHNQARFMAAIENRLKQKVGEKDGDKDSETEEAA